MGPSAVSSTRNDAINTTPEEEAAGACLPGSDPPPSRSAWAEAPAERSRAVQVLIDKRPPTAALPPTKQDWCGSKGTEWVPDGALGVDWSDACKTHDECYATPGANKFLCDYGLQQDISLACATQGGGILCHVFAEIYFHGVRTPQGEEAFERAQASASVKP